MAGRKKEEFMKKKNQKMSSNRVLMLFCAIIAVVGIGVFIMSTNAAKTVQGERWVGGNYNIGTNKNYAGKNINLTTIDYQIKEGRIVFPLEEVIEKQLVYTVFQNNQGQETPLMSYISPEGRLVTAFAICEPCRSLSFHIEGNELVCDSCGTRWHLNDLSGISGGCTDYPPEEIPYQVEDGHILVDVKIVEAWQPRG